MARYVLVEVDENDRADRLREKLDGVPGLRVIAMFGKPTKFCECDPMSDRSKRGKTYGWWCCPNCSMPKTDAMQSGLTNLLDQPGLPSQYRMVSLNIREPFSTPAEHYGQNVIDIKIQQIRDNWVKVQRRMKRVRRPRARR
jgi:hypothetical protein